MTKKPRDFIHRIVHPYSTPTTTTTSSSRLPLVGEIPPTDAGVTGTILDCAGFAAVADADFGGAPTVSTLLLGGLATAGAELELDHGYVGGCGCGVFVNVLLVPHREAYGSVGDAEAHGVVRRG